MFVLRNVSTASVIQTLTILSFYWLQKKTVYILFLSYKPPQHVIHGVIIYRHLGISGYHLNKVTTL